MLDLGIRMKFDKQDKIIKELIEDEQWISSPMMRPSNYNELEPKTQWLIDKKLGILDWTGNDEA